MKYSDQDKLPVDLEDNELPKDDNYQMIYDEKENVSGGFVNTIFLVGIIVVSFMWGMLAVILR